MSRKSKVLVIFALGIIFAAIFYLQNTSIPVLQPMGEIGEKQRNLLIVGGLLSVVIVVPVFVMLFMISWKYRQGNHKKTKYDPEWDHSKKFEITWWAIPSAIILILAVITWNSSHDLDPFKPLRSNTKPINIQVVALQWKWLFIYPDLNIATLNYVKFPVNTPINFKVTSDAPMNSFWIPSLGGQIYAMPGMSTKLHLIANKEGAYLGKSANISGEGFSRMTFSAEAVNKLQYNQWLNKIHRTGNSLTLENYNHLAEPSVPKSSSDYSAVEKNLYDTIVNKYMSGSGHEEHMEHSHGVGM